MKQVSVTEALLTQIAEHIHNRPDDWATDKSDSSHTFTARHKYSNLYAAVFTRHREIEIRQDNTIKLDCQLSTAAWERIGLHAAMSAHHACATHLATENAAIRAQIWVSQCLSKTHHGPEDLPA
jgi:hypothetical protein